MKTLKPPKVSIVIAAHNEEKNIQNILNSIALQVMNDFTLCEILVFLDGCTDTTKEKILNLELILPIEIIDDKKRLGKAQRVAQSIKISKGQIIVFLDADVVFIGKRSLQNLVFSFRNSRVGLVSGNDLPKIPKNHIQKVSSYFFETWGQIRKSKQDSIHNIHGAFYAIKTRSFLKIKIPKNLISDDQFFYIFAKKNNIGFVFCEDATVSYELPSSLFGYLRQSARFIYFNKNMFRQLDGINEEYRSLPKSQYFTILFKRFLRNPIYLTEAIILQIIVRLFIYQLTRDINRGKWQQNNK